MNRILSAVAILAVLAACGPGEPLAPLSPGAPQSVAFIPLDCTRLPANAHANEKAICADAQLQALDAQAAGLFATLAAAETPSPIAAGLKSTWGFYLAKRGGCATGEPKDEAERSACLRDSITKTTAAMTHVQRMRYGPAYADGVGLEVCPTDLADTAKADCFKLVEKNWDALRLLTAPLVMEKARAPNASAAVKEALEEANGWLAYDAGQCGMSAPPESDAAAAFHACKARANAQHYARLMAVLAMP